MHLKLGLILLLLTCTSLEVQAQFFFFKSEAEKAEEAEKKKEVLLEKESLDVVDEEDIVVGDVEVVEDVQMFPTKEDLLANKKGVYDSIDSVIANYSVKEKRELLRAINSLEKREERRLNNINSDEKLGNDNGNNSVNVESDDDLKEFLSLKFVPKDEGIITEEDFVIEEPKEE